MDKSLTQLIQRWQEGDATAENMICQAVLPRIRELAQGQLAQKNQRTLRATQLAGDVFLELRHSFNAFGNTNQLLSLAARIVRHSIVDHIRERTAEKRGRSYEIVPLDFAIEAVQEQVVDNDDWLVLDQALIELANVDERTLRLVELRYFAGMTVDEAAKELEISETTATRMWRFARAHLIERLGTSALAPAQ